MGGFTSVVSVVVMSCSFIESVDAASGNSSAAGSTTDNELRVSPIVWKVDAPFFCALMLVVETRHKHMEICNVSFFM